MIAACWRTGLHLALWAAVGAGAMLTALTALTIGVIVLPGTAALAALAAWRGDRRLAGAGILAGLGLPLLYVGYLNRGGPGTVCATMDTGQSCIQEMSPWPWVAVGLCLAGAGAALGLRTCRSHRGCTAPAALR